LPARADRTAAALGLLWTLFSGPLFKAGVELWVAARTDEVLRASLVPFERDLRTLAGRLVADLLRPPATDHPDFRDVVTLILNTMHGAALQRLLQPTSAFRRQQVLLERAVRLCSKPAPWQVPGRCSHRSDVDRRPQWSITGRHSHRCHHLTSAANVPRVRTF
jgi:hypothetical protein